MDTLSNPVAVPPSRTRPAGSPPPGHRPDGPRQAGRGVAKVRPLFGPCAAHPGGAGIAGDVRRQARPWGQMAAGMSLLATAKAAWD